MALNSPGVEVSINDEAVTAVGAVSTVPLVVVASAENKVNANGTSVATGTTKTNAGKLYQVTSPRDLLNLFGSPTFYKSVDGSPIHGYELNEYGLLAAHSLLGATNLCYVMRADVNLSELVGSITRPSAKYQNGTLWQNWSTTQYGLKVLGRGGSLTGTGNAQYYTASRTSSWPRLTVVQQLDQLDLVGTPNFSASVGSYAVVPFQVSHAPHIGSSVFYRTATEWVKVGSREWQFALNTAQFSLQTALDADVSVTVEFGTGGIVADQFTVELTTGMVGSDIASIINAVGHRDLVASWDAIKKVLSLRSASDVDAAWIRVTGFGEDGTKFYLPHMTVGGQNGRIYSETSGAVRNAVGSVWLDIESASSSTRASHAVSQMTLGAWTRQTVTNVTSTAAANASLDSVFGGKSIKQGTLIAHYTANRQFNTAPVQILSRLTTGEAVYVGTENPNATTGAKLYVAVSTPKTDQITEFFELTIAAGGSSSARSLVDAINAHPTLTQYLDAELTADKAVRIKHLTGGNVYMHDYSATGTSSGTVTLFGFNSLATTKRGPALSFSFPSVASSAATGTGAKFNVVREVKRYSVAIDALNLGSGYSEGEIVTIQGSVLGASTENNIQLKVTSVSVAGEIEGFTMISGQVPAPAYTTELSNWVQVSTVVNDFAPSVDPVHRTKWFYSVATEADIMVNVNGVWKGYRNVFFGPDGLPDLTDDGINAGIPETDPNGPIFSSSAPTVQSDGSPIVYGDLWFNTDVVDDYPVILRWQRNDRGVNEWTPVDVSDQENPSGVVFGDIRWAGNNSTDPISDPIPTIKSMLVSNYTDIDAVDPRFYPSGILGFNTRRSGFNVKEFRVNHFNINDYPDSVLPVSKNTWVSISGKDHKGVGLFGRKAQRSVVIAAMRSAIDNSVELRDETSVFSLIAAPGYPEVQSSLVTLNNDRKKTAHIIGDTPLRLSDQATELANWANNEAVAASTGDEGLVTRDEYMSLFYGAGLTTDLTGLEVVVPASHMMLRTFIRSDSISYPWFAAAGSRRGTVDNALSIGYIDRDTGEYVPTTNNESVRNVLYPLGVNCISFIDGEGLQNYGNRSSKDTGTARNRTNVSRLDSYLRVRVAKAVRPFVFEQNDNITRQSVQQVVNSIMLDLVSKRAITNYTVVCDETNNTPARIDANELWVDVAVVPTKSAEFLYVPLRFVRTGSI